MKLFCLTFFFPRFSISFLGRAVVNGTLSRSLETYATVNCLFVCSFKGKCASLHWFMLPHEHPWTLVTLSSALVGLLISFFFFLSLGFNGCHLQGCSKTAEEDQTDGGERPTGLWGPSARQPPADRRITSSQYPQSTDTPEGQLSGPGETGQLPNQKSEREAKQMSSPCQVGLFRKSGVKSRIQYLRDLVESDPGGVSYEGHSAFDIADMVKQYFRDLPEPIFTSKLCETFLHIYQCEQAFIHLWGRLPHLRLQSHNLRTISGFFPADFPKDQQLLAAQAAILLLPDENREALRALLFFLRDVVACVDENQMTPTNIAVCLAPSLFHLNTLKKDAKSPR